MLMARFIKNINTEIWFLLALSIFAWGPLLNPAYFLQAHDAQHSLFYLTEFDQTFRDGYWWPRWSPDFAFGYGYPLFNIYSPLSIYLAEIFLLLGASKVVAVKIVYALATIGSGLTMYFFVRRLFNAQAGLLAGIVYMVAPFHLLEIYVRSAFAEYASLVWLPLILWAFTELIMQPSFRRLALAGGSYGLLALTHHATFFTFTLFLMLYILALISAKAKTDLRQWIRLSLINLGASILGLAFAGIYLVPMILELDYIKVDQWTSGSYNALEHFVYFSQVFSPMWDYGYSGPGPIDGMSYQIGIVIYGLLVFALVSLLAYGQALPHRGIMLTFIGATLIALWLQSPLAEQVWTVLPITALIQFPWRLLIIVMLSMSIVIGALVAIFQPDSVVLSFITMIAVLGSYHYTQPQYTDIPENAINPVAIIDFDTFSPTDRVGMVAYTEQQPLTSPMADQYRSGEPLHVAGIIDGDASVTTIRHGGASDEILVEANSSATVQFYTYDYPGWQVRINGQPLAHRNEPPYGLITVDIPPGTHVLVLRMGTTPPRIAGSILSLLALGIIMAGVISAKKVNVKRDFRNVLNL